MDSSNSLPPASDSFVFPRWLGRLTLRLLGWRISGEAPTTPKYVLIGAPHTSNWDFLFMLAVAATLQLKITWMGKDSLFKYPLAGWVMRKLGGIPIDRSRPTGVVTQIVHRFKQSSRLILVVPPSGTRKRKEYWKSGFYWIALTAKVPIVCAYLDFGRKEGGIGPTIIPTGNIKADMDIIRTFYQDVAGKYPAQTTRVRLKEEDEDQPARE
ncbi:MAG: hypothetical protein FOGNACKC_00610 [Anaerolineae bacterium]|nr:hypothetical protein [Anaerolineae bacterium]